MCFRQVILLVSSVLLLIVFSGCNCDGGNKYKGQVVNPDPGSPGSDQKLGNLYMDSAGKSLKEGISKNISGQ